MVAGFIKPHRYLLLFYSAVFQVCFSCYWCLLDLDSSLSGLSTSSTVLSFHEPRNDPAAASGGALPSCLSARFYQTTLTCNLALRLSTVYLTFSLHRGCTEPWIKRETRAARYSEPSPLTYWELSVYQAWLRCSVHTVTISNLRCVALSPSLWYGSYSTCGSKSWSRDVNNLRKYMQFRINLLEKGVGLVDSTCCIHNLIPTPLPPSLSYTALSIPLTLPPFNPCISFSSALPPLSPRYM